MADRFDVTVVSFLYHAGYSCDGQAFEAERFAVQITNGAGRRWTSRVDFLGCVVHRDEEGVSHFEDVRPDAFRRASELATKVSCVLTRGERLDAPGWEESEPVYGSAAYVGRS